VRTTSPFTTASDRGVALPANVISSTSTRRTFFHSGGSVRALAWNPVVLLQSKPVPATRPPGVEFPGRSVPHVYGP
jgi:hypothetical protein